MFDFIIVGSGPAGMSAAYELQEQNVLVLDVGMKPPESKNFDGNLYDLKNEKDLFNELIGNKFESLHNLENSYLSPKLKAPLMRFITKDSSTLSPVISDNFEPQMSFAYGGLANAWGAGLLQFNDYDLENFPIKNKDLIQFYNKLTEIIGINGEDDDLSKYFGSIEFHQKSHKLSDLGEYLLSNYKNKRHFFHNQKLYIGKGRIGLLTEDLDDRQKTNYNNLEFFKSNIKSIFNPAYIMDKLINQNKIKYISNILVEKFEEKEDIITIYTENLVSKKKEIYLTRNLLLGAGTLNTSKIVLNSFNDFDSKLPILDNKISYIPFIVPKFIGSKNEKFNFSAQLMILYDDPKSKERIQGTYYGITSPLKSDFLFDFPLSIKGNLIALKYLLPALAIVQLFYPDEASSENYLKINLNNQLEINYKNKFKTKINIEKHIIKAFSKVNHFSHMNLCKFPNSGNSFHYAGSIPMKDHPKKYQTNVDGLLFSTKNIYIIDAANFSSLPSKNHSLTIMANSMRIANKLKQK